MVSFQSRPVVKTEVTIVKITKDGKRIPVVSETQYTNPFKQRIHVLKEKIRGYFVR